MFWPRCCHTQETLQKGAHVLNCHVGCIAHRILTDHGTAVLHHVAVDSSTGTIDSTESCGIPNYDGVSVLAICYDRCVAWVSKMRFPPDDVSIYAFDAETAF